MKLSTKIILPIILISALLILLALAGCFGVPADESPGYTPGTITGIIASPCCTTSAEPVSETCCIAPEYWCFYCQYNWKLQDGIEVVLTYGEDEVATTTTNEDGEYVFNDVPPGKNYVVTAYCPDYDDNRPLVKDVALEVASTFDAKITDLVSTSLGLVVDFLVLYTEWGPEDISLDEVLADRPNFPNFPKFKKLVYEVRRVLENCEVNLLTDDDVQDALCRAAEEISGLDIGCGAGYTPPPPPIPGACDGNLSAIIDSVSIDGDPVDIDDIVNVILGESYEIVVTAHDQDSKLGTLLTYYAKANGYESPATTSNQVTITPPLPGTFEVFVYVHDGCAETEWGPVTVEVDCCPLDPILDIDIDIQAKRSSLPPLCLDDCAIINSVTVNYTDGITPPLKIDDLNDSRLFWNWDAEKVSFNQSTGLVCLVGGLAGTPGTYTISVIYTDLCQVTASGSVDITFEDCSCPPLDTLSIAIDPADGTVCDDECATLGPVTVSFSDTTSDLVIDPDDASLTWDATPAGISFNASTGEVCLIGDPDTYTLGVTYEDECGETVYGTVGVTFELCCPPLDTLSIAIDPADGTVCDDECATLGPVTVSFSDTTSDLVIDPDDASLTWDATPAGISFNASTGEVCLIGDPDTYTLGVTYEDECGETVYGTVGVTFELCCDPPCCLPEWASFKTGDRGNWDSTVHTYFPDVELDDIGLGYNIWNGSGWYGWCADKYESINHDNWYRDKKFTCSIGEGIKWNKINWIINYRESSHTMKDVQRAIWYIIHDLDIWYYNNELSVNGRWLVDNADGLFEPAVGQKYAVIINAEISRCDIQLIFIEAIRTCHCPPLP